MKITAKDSLGFLQTSSHTISSALLAAGLIGFGWLLAVPAIAQQRPNTNATVCSTSNQSCSRAILSDGPLSVSSDGESQLVIDSNRELTLEQISESVNEQAQLEDASTQLGVGPFNINSGDRDRLGVRDNVRD